MTITRTTYTERVLIVLNPDGTLKGAHSEAVEIVRDGDEVLSAKQVPAAPIDATALASVLPDQAALVAQVAALTAERDALVAQAGQAQQAQAAASVSPYQAKMALLAAGLLDDVEALIAQSPKSVQLAWEYALSYERDSALIVSLGAALGLNTQQIDDLFAAAAAIEAK